MLDENKNLQDSTRSRKMAEWRAAEKEPPKMWCPTLEYSNVRNRRREVGPRDPAGICSEN